MSAGRINRSPTARKKRLTMDSFNYHEDGEDVFEDIRAELHATSFNLTSVLINPRETLMEDLTDEFSFDQNTPLMHVSPAFDTYMGVKLKDSKHVMAPDELKRFEKLVSKLRAVYADYKQLHKSQLSKGYMFLGGTPSSKKNWAGGGSMGDGGGGMSTRSTTPEDVLKCFREVPEIFFRSDFSLRNVDTFNKVIGSILFVSPAAPAATSEGDEGASKGSSNGKSPGSTTSSSANQRTSDNIVEEQQLEKQRQQQHVPLAYCLDLVEIALMRQICVKSPQFFRTIDDIRLLQTKVKVALENTIKIRKSMHNLNENSIKKALDIPRLQTRRANTTSLHDKLKSIRRVIEGRKAVLLLLQTEDYLSAMNIIMELVALFNDNQLDQISSVKSIGAELLKYQIFICDVMANKFVSMAVQWVEEDSGSSNHSSGTNGKSGGADKAAPSAAASAAMAANREYMEQLLVVLIKVGRFENALLMFKKRITDDVQLIWRTCALEYLQVFDPTAAMSLLQDGFPEDAEEYNNNERSAAANGTNGQATPAINSALFIQRWRELPADSFLASLEMCFDSLKISLSRYHNMHKFITFVVQTKMRTISPVPGSKDDGEKGPEGSGAATEAEAAAAAAQTSNNNTYLLEISKSCITAACTHALKDTLNLMKFRTESNIKMELPQMKRLWKITLDFIGYTERMARTSSSYDFKSFLTAQSKSFLYHLHEVYKVKLGSTLEGEKWVQCDVLPKYQQLITELSGGMMYAKSQKLSGSSSSSNLPSRATSAGSLASGTTTASAIMPATVDGSVYRVPWSVLLLVEQVVNILDIAESYPDMNLDIMSKIVILCQLFDQRADRLVLGAEAMQTAGLKSITAKHLAVTAQAYDLLLKLLPHVRELSKVQHRGGGEGSGSGGGVASSIGASRRSSTGGIGGGGAASSTGYKFDMMDTVMNSITEHHSSILTKFVKIVDDMMDGIAHRQLRNHDWDKMNSGGGSGSGSGTSGMQVDYFEEIQKNINSLYKTLLAILPTTQVVEVFSRIFTVLKIKISQHFDISSGVGAGAAVGSSARGGSNSNSPANGKSGNNSGGFAKQPNTLTGKQRILDEINYFVITLSRLKHVDTKSLLEMEEVFKKKYNINTVPPASRGGGASGGSGSGSGRTTPNLPPS